MEQNSCLLLESSTCSLSRWSPGSGGRRPCWRGEDWSQGPEDSKELVQDQVRLLGKYLEPSPPLRGSLFKDPQCERTQLSLACQPQGTCAPPLSRTLLCQLCRSCACVRRGWSFWAFHLPILTFAQVSVWERPQQTNHSRARAWVLVTKTRIPNFLLIGRTLE